MCSANGPRRETPTPTALPVHLAILDPAEGGQRAGEGLTGFVPVRLADAQVGAKQRQHQLQELGLTQNLRRRAAEPPQPRDQLVVRQLVHSRMPIGKVWRAETRHDQVHRAGLAGGAQRAGELEADQRAHAVPEEGKRNAESRNERRSQARISESRSTNRESASVDSRPGRWTAQSSTSWSSSGGSARAHGRNVAAPPPAKGKQIRRRRADGLRFRQVATGSRNVGSPLASYS